MPRCPVKKSGQKTKTLVVAPGNRICDPNTGADLKGGDKIALTKDQAEFYLGLGRVVVNLDFGDDAGEAEASAGSETDGSGEPAVGAGTGPDANEAAGDSKVGRRKSPL